MNKRCTYAIQQKWRMDTNLSSLPHYIFLPIPHLWHAVAVKEIARFNVTAVYTCVFGTLCGILFIILQPMLLLISDIVNSSWQYILILFYTKRVTLDTPAYFIERQRHHPKIIWLTTIHSYNSIYFLSGYKETFLLLVLQDEDITSRGMILELLSYDILLIIRWTFFLFESYHVTEACFWVGFAVGFLCLFWIWFFCCFFFGSGVGLVGFFSNMQTILELLLASWFPVIAMAWVPQSIHEHWIRLFRMPGYHSPLTSYGQNLAW